MGVVLDGRRLACQRPRHVRADLRVGGFAQHLARARLVELRRVDAEPLRVAFVDVAVRLPVVEVGDQRRDRIGDQPHLRFAALQLVGALGNAPLQLGRVLADLRFGPSLGGDVGIEREKTQAGDRHAAHANHLAVGTPALELVPHEAARQCDPLGHLRIGVAGTIIATLRIEAHQRLEREAGTNQRRREVEHPHEGGVPGHQLQVAIDE